MKRCPTPCHFPLGLALAALTGCAGTTITTPTVSPAFTTGQAARAPVAIINGVEQAPPPIRMGDPLTIARIIDEGTRRNKVMDHITHISTEIGPRLTGSSNAETANRWAADQFRAWGLTNVELYKWGEIPVRFDRGPSTGKLFAAPAPPAPVSSALADREARRRRRENPDSKGDAKEEEKPLRELEFTTLAWSGGTNGPVRAQVVRMPETPEELAKVKDQLNGSWVLLKPAPLTGRQGLRAVGGSMNDRALARYAIQTGKPLADLGIDDKDKERRETVESLMAEQRPLLEAGVAGFISSSRDERVWTTAFRRWRDLDPKQLPKDVEVSIRLSDYDYLNSRLADGEKVEAEFDLKHTFTPGPIPVYDTVAEIPGTDKSSEYVIVSAHLDSWNGPGSQGTTDNGTGSSVTLEAARLLMAAHAKPRRTIRFILWTGEEQGLLGSKKYVEDHPDLLPKISAVLVDDGGTNSEGGLKCTDAMAPMLAAATAPVNYLFTDSKDGKPLNVNIHTTGDKWEQSGGSDHASFYTKGVPGFFWDEVGRADYGHGWHTQHDRLDLAVPEYLKQSSTCAAITAYNLACAQDMLPRFPMPEEGAGTAR